MRKYYVFALIVLVASVLSATTQNRIIFEADYENLENAQLISSDGFSTAINFQLGGVEIEEADLSESGYVNVRPLAANPEKFGSTAEEGLPDLPSYSECVIIPDQAGVRVNIISADYETIPNIDIAPTQPFQLESRDDPMPFAKDETAYRQNQFYPGDVVAVSEPMIMRDFRFVQSVVYPFQYNPVTRELRVYSHIQYEVEYEGYDSRNVKIRRNNYISEAFLSTYKEYFVNAEVVLTDYIPQRGGYLIVAASACTTKAREFGEWKHQKGYDVQVLSTSAIGYTNTQVMSAIQSAYDSSDPKIEFVALIGDARNTTAIGYRIDTYTESYHNDNTDFTYGLLEGGDWEPDVFVGRMSVGDINHLNTLIARTLAYEKSPDMADPGYYKRGLVVAGNCCGTPNPTSPRLVNLWNRQVMLAHGYTHVDSVFAIGSESYPANYDTISNAISNGVSLVTYRGWSYPEHWVYPNWGISEISGLTNGWKLGVLASIVCGTGNFGYDYGQCLGEAWLRTGSETLPKGGVGFYGPTEGNTATRWNNTLMMGLVSALLEKGIYQLSPVLIAGKHHARESFPRMTDEDGWRFYYHIYNVLGDPELCIRTDTPKTMSVSYNSPISLGTNYLSIHVDADGGGPLENTYVCLVKGTGASEEVFTGGWTGASGDITLEFNAATSGDMHVTVSYRNYIPHLGICTINSQATMVAYNAMTIDDDNSGNSSGNSDGNVNPTETVELNIQLKNFGTSQAATNVNAVLTSSQPSVQVTVGLMGYPNISPGATAYPSSGKFAIHLDGDIEQDEIIELPLSVTTSQGTYSSQVFIQVKSMKFAQTGTSFPGNNLLDPGETTTMTVSLENIGDLNGQSLTGILSCNDAYIAIPDNSSSFGTINIGGTGSNGADPFNVTASSLAFDGRNVLFSLQLTSSGGVVSATVFSVVLGNVGTNDATGPDNYGYYMYDNTDTQYGDLAPTYNWVDLNSQPSAVEIIFDNTDDATELITLPFNFVYYGQTHTQMTVCINGFVSVDNVPFDQQGNYWYNFDNYPIPDPGNARGQISPFWDDLYIPTGATTGVYKWYDLANNRFIIEWSDLKHKNTNANESFQLIICDPAYYPTPTGDAEMIYQYQVINNNDGSISDPRKPETYSSVGFENWEENDGIQYEYDNVNHPAAAGLASGRAIKITTSTGSALQIPSLVSPPNNNISSDLTPTLTWSQSSEATKYHLQVANNVNFNSPIVNDSTLTALSYTFSSALPTGQYYWRVRAGDSSRWSAFSSSWSFVLSILEVPVTITPANSGSIYDSLQTFVWHRALGAVRYHIQIDNSSVFDSPYISNSNVNDTSYQASIRIPSGTSYWHIRAHDGVIWSNFSGTWNFSTSAPQPPVLSAPSNGNESSTDPPTFLWQAPQGGNAYDLVVSTHMNFSDTLLIYQGYQGTSITPLAAMGEGTYYWHVKADGDYGYSAFSSTFEFTINYGSTSYQYYPGDVNMRNGAWPPTVIGGDVTYLVNFFRGMTSSQPCRLDGFWCSADANGDCNIIGSDVTRLVNYFRGIATLSHCSDYEPAWNSPDEFPPASPGGWPNCEDVVTTSKITPGDSNK